MTVASTTQKVSYTAAAGQLIFPYTFKIYAATDLEVWTLDVNDNLTLETAYSVDGVGEDSGGNVTFVTAPGVDVTVTIKRVMPLLQSSDYIENDPFPAETLEDDLDKRVMISQQIQEQIGRAPKYGETSATTDISIEDPTADCFLVYNSTADGVINGPTVSDINEVAAAAGYATAASGSAQAAATSAANAATSASNASTSASNSQGYATDASGYATTASGYMTTASGYAAEYRAQPVYHDYMNGCIVANVTLSGVADDHDLTISAGQFADSTNTKLLTTTSGYTIQIDAVGVGGMFSGYVSANSLYYIFGVEKDADGTIDFGFDDNTTCTGIPSGYTKYRMMGWCLTDSSSNIIPFEQSGDKDVVEIWMKERMLTYSALSETSYTELAPDGTLPAPIVEQVLWGATAASADYVHLSTDGVNAKTIFRAASTTNTVGAINELYDITYASPCWMPLTTSGTFYYKTNTSNFELYTRAVRIKR